MGFKIPFPFGLWVFEPDCSRCVEDPAEFYRRQAASGASGTGTEDAELSTVQPRVALRSVRAGLSVTTTPATTQQKEPGSRERGAVRRGGRRKSE